MADRTCSLFPVGAICGEPRHSSRGIRHVRLACQPTIQQYRSLILNQPQPLVTSQSAILFSHNKSVPATSHNQTNTVRGNQLQVADTIVHYRTKGEVSTLVLICNVSFNKSRPFFILFFEPSNALQCSFFFLFAHTTFCIIRPPVLRILARTRLE